MFSYRHYISIQSEGLFHKVIFVGATLCYFSPIRSVIDYFWAKIWLMSNRVKNALYTMILLVTMFAVYKYRQTGKTGSMIHFTGQTMGPIVYNVKYFDLESRNFKTQVDSVLEVFNQSLNTYIPNSEISRFNKDSIFEYLLPYLQTAVEKSHEIYEETEGAFDPSIGPLINTWGFGYTDEIVIDSAVIDSLKAFVGFDKLRLAKDQISKTDVRAQLDFSASAKGYAVDVVLDLLKSYGVSNAFVEIGGEVAVAGLNIEKGEPWKIGILHPNSTELETIYHSIIELTDKGMATSGNYFNYQIIDGVKYGHTISPQTGYPIQHELLSASVIAGDCHTADALATAFMVFGLDKTKSFLEKNPQYDAFLIYSSNDGSMKTYRTSGIEDSVKPLN